MKTAHSFLATILLFTPAAITAQSSRISIPETEEPLTIRLSAKDQGSNGYSAITLTTNHHSTRITSRNPIVCIPADKQRRLEAGLWAEPRGMTLDRSRCFFRGTYAAGATPHTLLVFISEGYASNAAPILLLGFQSDATPYKVLERDELDPVAFEPADGTARFIGLPTLSQIMYGDGSNGSTQPYATTYDPYAVYNIRPDAPAAYSLDQSRSYNQRHYVWAGPRVSEDIAVIYNYPGRPRPFSIPAKQLDSLFAKLPKDKPKL